MENKPVLKTEVEKKELTPTQKAIAATGKVNEVKELEKELASANRKIKTLENKIKKLEEAETEEFKSLQSKNELLFEQNNKLKEIVTNIQSKNQDVLMTIKNSLSVTDNIITLNLERK